MSYKVFTNQTPEIQLNVLRILSWVLAPLQRMPKHRAATLNLWFSKDPMFSIYLNTTCSTFHEVFCPFSVFPTRSSGFMTKLASLVPNIFRFSQPLDVYTTSSLPVLFHTGSAHGVKLFKAFFLSRSRLLFLASLPS